MVKFGCTQCETAKFGSETLEFTIAQLAEALASIYGVRVHDNAKDIWYNVDPEGQQAYCTPGLGGVNSGVHVVFGGMNVGGADGNLWGRLTDDTGKEIIPATAQWCVVGAFVWWELTFDMPNRDYRLTIEVGHDTLIDQSLTFTVKPGVPPEIPWLPIIVGGGFLALLYLVTRG